MVIITIGLFQVAGRILEHKEYEETLGIWIFAFSVAVLLNEITAVVGKVNLKL